MNISIETIPHNCQRYDTVGDWAFNSPSCSHASPDELMVNVSKMQDWRSELAVAIHEVVEALLCQASGIDEQTVDNWDMTYKGPLEPGDALGCPYMTQHITATTIEMKVCHVLGLKWEDHEKNIKQLEGTYERNDSEAIL